MDLMKTNCPHCGRLNTHHDTSGEQRPPKDGDTSLCWKCGGAAVFTDDGNVRLPTLEEEAELAQDPDVKKFRYAMAEALTPDQAIRMVNGDN